MAREGREATVRVLQRLTERVLRWAVRVVCDERLLARRFPRATVAKTAAALGVAERTIVRWVRAGWVVRRLDGSIDLDATREQVKAQSEVRREV